MVDNLLFHDSCFEIDFDNLNSDEGIKKLKLRVKSITAVKLHIYKLLITYSQKKKKKVK